MNTKPVSQSQYLAALVTLKQVRQAGYSKTIKEHE
jgi:hypothetical protein